jgi:hypothetical protein
MPCPIALILTPHGRLTLVQDDDAAAIEAGEKELISKAGTAIPLAKKKAVPGKILRGRRPF